MAFSKQLQKAIENLSLKGRQSDILACLKKELESKSISPEDVYSYAKDNSRPKKNTFVIDADTINQLGTVVFNLPEDNDKAIQFYHLAAKRNCAAGCHNYAQCLLLDNNAKPKTIETALDYAKKAIDLAQDAAKKNEYQYIYAKALKAHYDVPSALTAIIKYLSFAIEPKNAQKSNIINAVALCNELMTMCLDIINTGDFDHGLAHEHFQEPLLAFQAISTLSNKSAELLILRNKAYLLAGLYYSYLEEESKAWLAYCQAEDNSPFYEDVVTARKDLLKNFIEKRFNDLIAAAAIPIENVTLNEHTNSAPAPQQKTEDMLLLVEGIPFPLNFSQLWNKETDFFHSVNPKEVEKHCDEYLALIDAKIDDKSKEINAANQADEKKRLTAERQDLITARQQIADCYVKYLADYRRFHRRYQTESRFFNPSHFKKESVLEKIKNLTLAIIEQRFSLKNSSSFDLTRISSRMVITAERVFQEAIIALSRESTIELGIPKIRGNKWNYEGSSGTNWYGPIERYQVASTEIQVEHRVNPNPQRLGDSYLPQHGTYAQDIFPFLQRLANNNPNNEKRIAQYLIRYGKTHQTVTLAELQELNANADASDVNHFNRAAFLIMEKEQGQWHSAGESFQVGMIVAQARSLILLEAGILRLKDLFVKDPPFGIYSQTNLIHAFGKVDQACAKVEERYTSFILDKNQNNDAVRFFNSKDQTQQEETAVLTRKQARQDLRDVYGGETDSDGEGYGSDLDPGW